MTGLDFTTKPPFECPDDKASDVAFIKATHTIGSWDAVEEYMACGLFPLSTSFDLCENADGETPVSKLAAPMPKFPITRLPEETNDGFWARVELAVVNVVGRYAYKEHKVCLEAVLNERRANRVFEQAGVPYGPRFEPGSNVCEEAEKKRKSDSGAGPSGKCMKVSDRKTVPTKASTAPKGVSVASLKTMLAKASHVKPTPKDSVVPGTRVPLKVVATTVTVVSKTAVTVTASRDGVLRINTKAKRSAIAPSPAAKGNHVRIDVMPPLASATLHKVLV
jgi:hypothetical protein